MSEKPSPQMRAIIEAALTEAHLEGRRSALSEIQADVDRFIKMEISAGKLAELYGWDKHGFKIATHSHCECRCGSAPLTGDTATGVAPGVRVASRSTLMFNIGDTEAK